MLSVIILHSSHSALCMASEILTKDHFHVNGFFLPSVYENVMIQYV